MGDGEVYMSPKGSDGWRKVGMLSEVGGYTGTGREDEVAGIVHPAEAYYFGPAEDAVLNSMEPRHPWSDPNHDIGADLREAAKPIERTITFESAEIEAFRELMKPWDEPKPKVSLQRILADARAYRENEATKELLKTRLNSRWRYHRHPDAKQVIVERSDGIRMTYPHVMVTAQDNGDISFDPMPVPFVDDRNYYLRNPS